MRPPSIHRIPEKPRPEKRRNRDRGKRNGARSTQAPAYICRSTIIFLISTIAFAGLSPFGQVCAQFMIVWHL